jgi:hypothetical protein
MLNSKRLRLFDWWKRNMTVVKVCKKHGKLKKEDIYFFPKKRERRCIKCASESRKKYREENREKQREYDRKFYQKNKYKIKNKYKEYRRLMDKKYKRKNVINLTDYYIKWMLRKEGFEKIDITKELIDARRQLIEFRRIIKEVNNVNK